MRLEQNITIDEGETFWLLGQPKGPSGDTITRLYVSSGSLRVFDRTSGAPNTAVYTKALLAAVDPPTGDNCMFETPQEDDNWDGRSGGYTFWWEHSPIDFTLEGGRVYRFEVELTVDKLTGQVFPILDSYGMLPMTWIVTVKGRASV